MLFALVKTLQKQLKNWNLWIEAKVLLSQLNHSNLYKWIVIYLLQKPLTK